MSNLRDNLESITGHRFNSDGLAQEALTHPSVGDKRNYQRLEFLGDRVLGLIIAAWLIEKFANEDEGSLNRRLAALVRRETCAEVAEEAGLDDLIRIDPSAVSETGKIGQSALGDVCEAVIGALYLDGGLEASSKFVKRFWSTRMGGDLGLIRDSKSELQEWAQARGLALPRYKVKRRRGPDHSPVFTIEVTVEGYDKVSAKGASKRLAEQAAARKMLNHVDT